MRQNEIFEKTLNTYESDSYIQNLLLNEGDQMLLSEPYSMPTFSRSSSLTSQVQLDRSTYNSVSQEVVEMKTLLLMVRRLLEKVKNSFLIFSYNDFL